MVADQVEHHELLLLEKQRFVSEGMQLRHPHVPHSLSQDVVYLEKV